MKQKILSFLNKNGVHIMSRRRREATDPFALQQRLLKNRPPSAIVDCGAHRGKTVHWYRSAFPHATVYGFEPTPASYAIVKERFKDDPKVVLTPAGLSDRPGKATMNVYAETDCNTLLRAEQSATAVRDIPPPESVVEVDLLTLDDFCAQRQITQIGITKMDVEGYELPVMRGATGLLQRQAIDVIYAEVRLETAMVGGTRYADLANFLHGFGYRAFGLYNFFYDDGLRVDWGDALFVSETCYQQYRKNTAASGG